MKRDARPRECTAELREHEKLGGAAGFRGSLSAMSDATEFVVYQLKVRQNRIKWKTTGEQRLAVFRMKGGVPVEAGDGAASNIDPNSAADSSGMGVTRGEERRLERNGFLPVGRKISLPAIRLFHNSCDCQTQS